MQLLTFFVPCLCQLGGTEIKCEDETESQNAGFVTRIFVATRWTNGFKCDKSSIGKHVVIIFVAHYMLLQQQYQLLTTP